MDNRDVVEVNGHNPVRARLTGVRPALLAVILTACGGGEPSASDPYTPGGSSSDATPPGTSAGLDDGGSTSGTGSTSSSEPGGESSSSSSSTGDGEPAGCAVVDQVGACGHVTECGDGSSPFAGLCDGPPSEQCCVGGTACSVDGAPGLCMSVDDCGYEATPGLCPGDASVQCCADPATACDPEAMPTPNDGLVEVEYDPACPAGMIPVAGFCIDRYEASLVRVGDGSSWSPYFPPVDVDVRAVSIEGAVPQGYIDQVRAGAACMAAGKRLCTDVEWLRACQGATGQTYPYGDAHDPAACNGARERHPVVEYFGTSEDWIWSELGHPCISQLPVGLGITGQYGACVSEDGAFDMVGNLHEWTADPAGTFRGGFYVDTAINGAGCLYATTAHSVGHWDYSTGFRCCADPR